MANNIELPEILLIPDKLLPAITKVNSYRYALIEGGRGGGKSQAIGRFILYAAEQRNCRIVCGRETQNSIAESVYSLLSDLIRQFNLAFDIQASKIIHKVSGSTINFRGFREQGRFNIQGLEGVDILWIDESQAITKQTLDVLIPTIRKERAKVFFTMNRHVEHDPVYETFYNRPDCLHIHINYVDNPFCTEALRTEAEECKKKSEADYRHIWLGEPLALSEDCLFAYRELKNTTLNKHPLREGYGLRLAGFDIARYGDDKCACVIIQQMGALHWEVVYTDQWEHKDLNYTTGRILSTSNEQNVIKSIIDEDGIGAGPLDTLNKGRGLDNFTGFRNPPLPYKSNKECANPRTVNAYKLKKMIGEGHFVLTDEQLIQELTTLRFTYDHYQRKILVSKEKMRAEGIASPNLGDACLMACSLIGEIRYDQVKEYEARQPALSPEGNLFEIAGIK